MSSPTVTIIDYGMGNVGSVRNALEAIGARVSISSSENDIRAASHLILPGVGSFPDGMRKLQESGALEPMKSAVIRDGKPILGICLGMQMLAEMGEEMRPTKGLGWIKGRVRRFEVDESKFHLPHVGWNDVKALPTSKLLNGIKRTIFYFVHSYHLVAEDAGVVSGTTDYGEPFAAAIEQGTIFGVQFHPEKSQDDGLALLRNFLRIER